MPNASPTTPPRTRPQRARERATASCGGFALIELIVVMVIFGILMGVLALGWSSSNHRYDTQYAAAASVIWEGAMLYRNDHEGRFPPASEVASGNFVDANGDRYVNGADWPDDPARDLVAITVESTSCPTPPTTGTPHTVAYSASATGTSACIAAYGASVNGVGKLVFRRAVVDGGSVDYATQGPLG